MDAVETYGLTRLYAAHRGIEGATLRLARGEVFGFLGPNGSGKSTLLGVLATRLGPRAGSFRILGHDGAREPAAIRRLIGYLPEGTAHWGTLSGFQNAWFFARAYGLGQAEARARLEGFFTWAGLWDQRGAPVETYSYGMKRKLALLEALVHLPPVLLLDEPTLGLDYASEVALRARLAELAAAGTTVLIATNDVALAQAVCHRVAFLHRGRVAETGRPGDFLAALGGRVEIALTLTQAVDPALLRGLPGVEAVTFQEGGPLVVAMDRPGLLADVVSAVTAGGGRIAHVRVREPDLGDAFIRVTGESMAGGR
ncbi:MAG: ABC transporter ATP-binding protein [Chloroflexota bacterium]